MKDIYYSDGCDEIIYELSHWEDELYELISEEENTIDFIELEEMKPMKGEGDARWCTYHLGLLENGECGKLECGDYEPQNGVKGKCRFKTFAYEGTGIKFKLSKDGLNKIQKSKLF